jgi:hypothetical protein
LEKAFKKDKTSDRKAPSKHVLMMTSVCCQIPLEEASPHVFVSHRWMDLFLGYVVHHMLCNKIGSNSKMTKYVEPSILRRGR